MSELHTFLGRRLHDARLCAGISESQLGEALGLSTPFIQDCELGRRRLRAASLARAARILEKPLSYFFSEPWIALELSHHVLSEPRFDALWPLVNLWQAGRGRMTEDFDRTVEAPTLRNRAILLRRLPESSRLVHERVPTGVCFMAPCQWLHLIGRDVEELPDQQYGAWAKKAYLRVIERGEPRLDAVRATVRGIDGAIIQARYDRLVLPWQRTGTDLFVSVVSIRREISIAR